MADKGEFNAELIKAHKGVTVVLVPFDPEEGWSRKPVRLHERRHGWLIRGTANGVPFDGYIGERWADSSSLSTTNCARLPEPLSETR